MQYGATLKLASQNQEQYGTEQNPEDVAKRLEGVAGAARGLANRFERPGPNFQVSVTESLEFSNSPDIARDLLRDDRNLLVGQMKELEDSQAAASLAIRSALGREPAEEEVQWITTYLEARRVQYAEACQQVVWSLLTSSELRFNY